MCVLRSRALQRPVRYQASPKLKYTLITFTSPPEDTTARQEAEGALLPAPDSQGS